MGESSFKGGKGRRTGKVWVQGKEKRHLKGSNSLLQSLSIFLFTRPALPLQTKGLLGSLLEETRDTSQWKVKGKGVR
jgi:hypothetical protein